MKYRELLCQLFEKPWYHLWRKMCALYLSPMFSNKSDTRHLIFVGLSEDSWGLLLGMTRCVRVLVRAMFQNHHFHKYLPKTPSRMIWMHSKLASRVFIFILNLILFTTLFSWQGHKMFCVIFFLYFVVKSFLLGSPSFRFHNDGI